MYSICWGSCWYYLTVLQSSIKHLDFFHWSFSPPWAAASWDTVCEVSYLGLSFLFFCCLAVCPATSTPLEGAAHPRLCHFSGCAEEGPPSPGWLYNWQPNRRVITVMLVEYQFIIIVALALALVFTFDRKFCIAILRYITFLKRKHS